MPNALQSAKASLNGPGKEARKRGGESDTVKRKKSDSQSKDESSTEYVNLALGETQNEGRPQSMGRPHRKEANH